MLVLTRKEGQRLNLHTRDGEQITICVVRTGRNTRIGIEAPEGVNIAREELEQRAPLREVPAA